MKFFTLLKTSAKALKKYTLLSFLTILGITIGTSAIIITCSIKRGAEEKIAKQISEMGKNTVYIIPSSFVEYGGLLGTAHRMKLYSKNVNIIKKQSPEVLRISPMHITAQQVRFDKIITQQSIIGSYPEIRKISESNLRVGCCFNFDHMKAGASVAILGATPAEKFFGDKDPIGQTVFISGFPFKVLGVLEKKKYYFGPRDPNERIFIPYTTSKKLLYRPPEEPSEITSIAIRLYRNTDIVSFRRKVANILRVANNIPPETELPFTIFDTKTLTEVAQGETTYVVFCGLIVILISLLLGGFGLINVMLTAVKERKKEIELRMAAGATRDQIALEFLTESAMLCFVSGLIGVILGLVGQFVVGYGIKISPVVEPPLLFFSLITAVFIGIFFGYYPARKAALLNPAGAPFQR